MPTACVGDAAVLAARAVEDGFDVVVAAGGDGTLNEVVNGLAPSVLAGHAVRFAVLPMGTANVFALEYELPFDVARAWNIIEQGRERNIDLACASYQTPEGARARHFIQLAGAGLDAHAVFLLNWRLKKCLGKGAYAVAMFQALVKSRCALQLRTGGTTHCARWVLIGNGVNYAGKYRFFPNARPDDGLIDLCLFERLNPIFLSRCALRLLSGGVLDFSGIKHVQSESFEIHSDTEAHLELDGENAGTLPATFSVRKQALRLIC